MIKKRESAAAVQEGLGLGDWSYEKFKGFTRRAHIEYCSGHPDSQWANIGISWTAIPGPEKEEVIQLARKKCNEVSLFEEGLSLDIVGSGIDARLYEVRRAWQDNTRSKQRQEEYQQRHMKSPE